MTRTIQDMIAEDDARLLRLALEELVAAVKRRFPCIGECELLFDEEIYDAAKVCEALL